MSNINPGSGRTAALRQSAAFWPYRSAVADLPEFVRVCRDIGLEGIDLVDPDDWPLLDREGMVATMVSGAGTITEGLNDRANHARCLEEFRRTIPAAAAAGWPNVITFSGSRAGRSDKAGIDASVEVLRAAAPIAEKHGVTICIELLNSKVDHRDYQCDRTAWGVEVCRRVASPRVKLLYDIYHAQIMEGDVIRTIEENIDWIGHFHTAGNPGRSDLDEKQELNYRPIAETVHRLVAEGRYSGWVAHEFHPKHGMESLAAAVKIWG